MGIQPNEVLLLLCAQKTGFASIAVYRSALLPPGSWPLRDEPSAAQDGQCLYLINSQD